MLGCTGLAVSFPAYRFPTTTTTHFDHHRNGLLETPVRTAMVVSFLAYYLWAINTALLFDHPHNGLLELLGGIVLNFPFRLTTYRLAASTALLFDHYHDGLLKLLGGMKLIVFPFPH